MKTVISTSMATTYYQNIVNSRTLRALSDLVPAAGSYTFVNGVKIVETVDIKQGSRVILGVHHVFRFNNPEVRVVRFMLTTQD